MADARCSCGGLSLTAPAAPILVVACHCQDCQRRTGSPFGAGAWYRADSVVVSGTPREFARTGTSGGSVRNYFCPDCGTTLFWRAELLPAMVAVALGALTGVDAPPARSVFERLKRPWLHIDALAHLPGGSAPPVPD